MATNRRYTFAPLQAMHYTPPQLVQMAAQAGVWGVGLRLTAVVPGARHYPLHDDAPALRETQAVLRDTGIVVFDIEMVRIGEVFDAAAHERVLATAQTLGARLINVLADDTDLSRLAASYASLCELAARYGLSCDVEPTPWSPVRDVAIARRLLEAVAQPNVGVLVDALHWSRAGTPSLDDVAALPREWVHYAQICDGRLPGPATQEGLIHDARCERLLPGEGDIDLAALFARLPDDVPINIEVPNDRRAPVMGYEAWARASLDATRRVLEPVA
jgi:sugar phosphate isomerase/epimerase